MDGRLRAAIRQRSWLHGPLRLAREGLDAAGLRLAETLAGARAGHEILVVFGMRRSGNHLAIAWMLGQVRGAAAFYNNIDPGRAPRTARMTEYRLRAGPAPRTILSYEDVDGARLLSPPLLETLAAARARGTAIRFALVLRDPYNLFASRLQKWPERFADEAAIAAQQAMYAEHARLARERPALWKDAPLVPILYNRLVVSAEARRDAARDLGIADGARGLGAVPVYGHGSSFEGTTDDPDLRRRTAERWRAQIDNPVFRKLVDDPRLADAAQALFGMAPPFSTP